MRTNQLHSKRALFRRLGLTLALLGCGVLAAHAVDSDGDGMSDEYETFFGLNVSNPGDAPLDYDGDGLSNLEESMRWTDPFVEDTDWDGFVDGADSNALSRAVFYWGDSAWCQSNDYVYTGPAWWLAAAKENGEWASNRCWHVAWWRPVDTGRLLIDVDRAVLTNDTVLDLYFCHAVGASLHVDLLDTNGLVVASNLVGNLMQPINTDDIARVSVPWSSNAAAARLALRRGSGTVTIYDSSLYIDRDGDGLDEDQETQLGLSDLDADGDDDGLNDYAEALVSLTDPLDADTDDDGLSDYAEVVRFRTDPLFADTDIDGLPDAWEIAHGLNPTGFPFAALAGFWRMEETNGLAVLDSSEHQNHGLLEGALRVDGWVGRALAFETTNDLIVVNNASIYKAVPLTIAASARFASRYGHGDPDAPDGLMVILAQQNTNDGLAYGFYKTVRNRLVFEVTDHTFDGEPATYSVSTPDDFVVRDEWYSLLGTCDGTNLRFYVNGTLMGETSAPAPTFAADSGLNMGRGVWAGGLHGTLDEVMVLNTALDEIGAGSLEDARGDADGDGLNNLGEYLAGSDPALTDTDGDGLPDAWEVAHGANPTNLDPSAAAAWWKLDESEGAVAFDSTVNSNHGAYAGTEPVEGPIGRARTFDGNDDEIAVSGDAGYQPETFAVSFYCVFDARYGNTVSGGAEDGVMELLVQPDAYRLLKTERNALVFEVYGNGVTSIVRTAEDLVSTGVWFHVAGVCDGEAVRLYVNGLKAGDVARTEAPDYNGGLTIGNGAYGAFMGQLDDVRIFQGGLADEAVIGLAMMMTDEDGDGLSYHRESVLGTDPLLADSDGDGVADAVDTDPMVSPDGDGDGLPDEWERLFFGNLDYDAWSDFDGDRLYDGLEYMAGTDPTLADSDGDGVSDYIEVHSALTDPLLADFDGTQTVLLMLDGSDATTNRLGTWMVSGGSIFARERNGYLEYEVELPSNGVFALEVTGQQHNELTDQDAFEIELLWDGVSCGEQTLVAPYGVQGTNLYILPIDEQGVHIARLQWNNLLANTFLQIDGLRLLALGGVEDWMPNRVEGLISADEIHATSWISPVCLEGEARYPETLCIEADYIPEGMTQQIAAVRRGIGEGWFADVALSPSNATAIVLSETVGGLAATNSVTWTPLNTFAWTNNETPLTIRKNDSVMFSAIPEGETNGYMYVAVLGEQGGGYHELDDPVILTFTNAGVKTVYGQWIDEYAGMDAWLTVRVLEADFPLDPALVAIGYERTLDCDAFSEDAEITYDDALQLTDIRLGWVRRLKLLADVIEPARVVARLPDQGAIIDAMEVRPVYGERPVYAQVVSSFADGGQMLVRHLTLGNVSEDMAVVMTIVIGGVTFDDGSLTRTLTADDFNELGEYTYYLVQAPGTQGSICHTTTVLQNGESIHD